MQPVLEGIPLLPLLSWQEGEVPTVALASRNLLADLLARRGMSPVLIREVRCLLIPALCPSVSVSLAVSVRPLTSFLYSGTHALTSACIFVECCSEYRRLAR